MKTAIVIPAYNEAATIGEIVTTIGQHGLPIVIDDGSTDGTGQLAEEAGAEVIRHSENRGYDSAIESGFRRAAENGFHFVITFDADGQHEPSLLPEIISRLTSGEVELVIGIRARTARWSEALFNAYTRIRFGIDDILCGVKGYSMSLYRAHGCFDSTCSIGTELALTSVRHGANAVSIPVKVSPRRGTPRLGSSFSANWKILRALSLALSSDLGSHRNPGKTVHPCSNA